MTYANLFKVWATVLVAILAAILLSTAAFTTGAGAQERPCSGNVVLDAGHGGTDPGAENKAYDLEEQEQTLDVANKLRDLLVLDGCTVHMTRTREDQSLTNTQRANKANSFKANDPGEYVLVSIHMNASSNPSTDYTTTLFGKWRKDKELAYAVFGDNVNSPKINPPTYGLRTLSAVNGGGTTGGTIATKTPYSFASGVLLKSNMPATIAETVFITNTDEANQLADPTTYRRQQIAEALKTGIEHYLRAH